jgi:hypothetical protein
MQIFSESFKTLAAALVATCIAQAVLIIWGFNSIANPIGDLDYAYHPWIQNMISGHYVLGLNHHWVYPIGALVPIYIAWLISHGENFIGGWYLTEVAFQLLAVSLFLNFGRASSRLKWVFWYLVFMVSLGPVAVSRIESFAVPLALITLGRILDGKTGVALSTINAWIKVWPVVFIASVVTATKDRLRQIAWAFSISAGLVLAALVVGGNLADLFSFVTDQSNRNTQVESIFALPSLWYGAFSHTQPVVYNQVMLTLEVSGKYSHLGSLLSAPLLTLALVAAILLGWRAAKSSQNNLQLTALLTLNLALALIAFNKVGSPQYIDWLIVPILFVMATSLKGNKIYLVAMLVVCALTNIIYPVIYGQILSEQPEALAVLTLRNLLVLGLWLASICQLTGFARATR